jgi:hypothetical protein
MAAGLPSVISDWNGYRDTVRHGLDGFRASTYTPRAGLGGDLAFRHSVSWDSYDGFVGAVSQFTAVDIGEAAQAIVDLVKDPALRKRMGDSARRRAQEVFDWSAVIPQYQDLWADMAALRPKLKPQRSRGAPDNPWRLDPYRLFSSYPSEQLTSHTLLSLAPGVTPPDAAELRAAPIVKTVVGILPPQAELERIIGAIMVGRRPTVASVLNEFPQARRLYMERCIVLLAKYGLVVIHPKTATMDNP